MSIRVAIVLATLVFAGSGLQSSNISAVFPIDGGTFEASGVVALSGGVLFVDDGRPDEVFWMPLDGAGRQTAPARSLNIGIPVHDKEGITTDGTHIYVVGSQSKKESAGGVGLVRFKFDAKTQQASDAQSIADLRGLIGRALPEVGRAAGKKEDGLNIEGLAWDAAGKRLLLGLRAPVIDGQALVIPMRVKHPDARFDAENVEIAANSAAKLPLGGGIRSIEYDAAAKDFTILSAGEGKSGTFSLWRWNGSAAPQRRPLGAHVADRRAKPEGIARVTAGGSAYTFVVFDTSQYATLP
jgi:Protein of unknown function (DUF3616)